MEMTIIQALIIFVTSLVMWMVIEYLFYRVQHFGRKRLSTNSSDTSRSMHR